MSKTTWILFAALPLFALRPAGASNNLLTDPTLIIASEGRCVESRGIPINNAPDNQVKVACLRDRQVQTQCNPDGHHARVQAFRQWESQLMDFKERCTGVGGAFTFAQPGFLEPANDSFCSVAEPEVSYDAFESPLCNFVSRCPQVAVTCLHTEESLQTAQRIVQLPGIPHPITVAAY